MELPISVFILLFILVMILIFLHLSNQKYADKISVLEQALNMKLDDIASLQRADIETKASADLDRLEESLCNSKDEIKELTDIIEYMHEKLHQKDQDFDALKIEYEDKISQLKNNTQVIENKMLKIKAKNSKLTEEMQSNVSQSKELKVHMEEMSEIHKNEITKIENETKAVKDVERDSGNKEYMDVLKSIHNGNDITEIAKQFDIPVSRVELIEKFDKMQKNK